MAHELGRGTFATVMKAMARITGCWWAVKIIHTQKLHPSNNNNEYDSSGRNGHCSPTTPMTNPEREINILEKLDHPNIFPLCDDFPLNK
jgi:serine/threonine/tyrosine protein kinase RAD53